MDRGSGVLRHKLPEVKEADRTGFRCGDRAGSYRPEPFGEESKGASECGEKLPKLGQ